MFHGKSSIVFGIATTHYIMTIVTVRMIVYAGSKLYKVEMATQRSSCDKTGVLLRVILQRMWVGVFSKFGF